MSLARTALRVLVVEALKGATMAGPRVFDSMMADLSPDLFKGDENPTAIVLTDKDEGDALSAQNGGPPFGRATELSIEMGMTQRVRAAGETDDLIYPNTDARLEAALDMFEFQVLRHLQYSDDELCILFRRFWRITKFDCHRQTFEDSSVKVACRLLTLHCFGGDERVLTRNIQAPLPVGFDLLPDPIRSVAQALPVGCSGHNVCNLILAAHSNLTLPEFKGIDTVFDGGNTTQGDVPSTEIEGTINVETLP